MTMINPPPSPSPPDKISKQNRYRGGYGGGFGVMGRLDDGYECCTLGSDLFIGPMAEDGSRTESVNEEEGSSSKGVVAPDEEMRDQGWLQLGIGGGSNRVDPAPSRSGLVELDLLPGDGSSEQVMTSSASTQAAAAAAAGGGVVFRRHMPPPNSRDHSNISSSFFLQYRDGNPSAGFPHHHQKINWGFRPNPQLIPPSSAAIASSSSSSFFMPGGSYLGRPFQLHGSGVDAAGGGGDGVGSSSGFSVIDPPRRPHSGLWFMLQVSQNQSKEPFLPQIPKSYLRIKDGRMTVRLLMKYLVNKLRLNSESEIEIRCRGQQLLPFLTLQHVREHIWRTPTDTSPITLLPDSSTADHVMVLNYGRSP